MTMGDGDRSRGLTLLRHGDADITQSPNLNPTNIHGSSGIVLEGKILTVADAQQCLNTFKETLTPEDYQQFILILTDFHQCRIDKLGLREKVIKLCEAHQQLVPVFNVFLPQRDRIIFPEAEDDELYEIKDKRLFDVFLQFIEKVKVKLQDDDDLYSCFVGILNWYRLGQRTVSEVHQVITYLFYDHKDLLKEFNSLSSRYYNSSPATTIMHSEKETIASGSEPPRRDEKGKKINDLPIKKRFVPILEETVMSGFPQDMHEQVFSLNAKVKERLYKTDDYRNFLKCIKYYHSENISRTELNVVVKDLLGAHPDLMEAFNKVIDHKTKTDKTKEDEAFKEKGKRKRESLLTPGTKRSNKDKNKAKPVREPKRESRTPSCRLIPCDFVIPEASQKRRWINKC